MYVIADTVVYVLDVLQTNVELLLGSMRCPAVQKTSAHKDNDRHVRRQTTAPVLLADCVTTGNRLKNGVHCGL